MNKQEIPEVLDREGAQVVGMGQKIPFIKLYSQLVGVILDNLDETMGRCQIIMADCREHLEEAKAQGWDTVFYENMIEHETGIINACLEQRGQLASVQAKMDSYWVD